MCAFKWTGDVFDALARTAEPAEKPDLWRMMVKLFSDYADYQAGTNREIPLVIIERR